MKAKRSSLGAQIYVSVFHIVCTLNLYRTNKYSWVEYPRLPISDLKSPNPLVFVLYVFVLPEVQF